MAAYLVLLSVFIDALGCSSSLEHPFLSSLHSGELQFILLSFQVLGGSPGCEVLASPWVSKLK